MSAPTEGSRTELLPCPFCGGAPRAEAHEEGWIIGCWVWECVKPITWRESEAEAIAAWNRRTPASTEGAEEALDDLMAVADAIAGVCIALDHYQQQVREYVLRTSPDASAAVTPGETESRWRDAALQARRDLQAIEDETAAGNPPLLPGGRFAEWTSPANTMRMIDRMVAEEPIKCRRCGQPAFTPSPGCPGLHRVPTTGEDV